MTGGDGSGLFTILLFVVCLLLTGLIHQLIVVAVDTLVYLQMK